MSRKSYRDRSSKMRRLSTRSGDDAERSGLVDLHGNLNGTCCYINIIDAARVYTIRCTRDLAVRLLTSCFQFS